MVRPPAGGPFPSAGLPGSRAARCLPQRSPYLVTAPLRACDSGRRVPAATWVAVAVVAVAVAAVAAVVARWAETRSPAQIAGYLKANGQPTVSHENIYPQTSLLTPHAFHV